MEQEEEEEEEEEEKLQKHEKEDALQEEEELEDFLKENFESESAYQSFTFIFFFKKNLHLQFNDKLKPKKNQLIYFFQILLWTKKALWKIQGTIIPLKFPKLAEML